MNQKRLLMVKEQLIDRGIHDEAVLQAMAEVPRHRFVQGRLVDLAYQDRPLPIEGGQTISQPYIVARMVELLQLKPANRVLDVGAGSGYAAAVISRIVDEVYAIERHEPLVRAAAAVLADLNYDNVRLRQGDGSLGWPQYAPFDAISVAAAGPNFPQPLLSQLAVNGRLVMPVGNQPSMQTLKRVRRVSEDEYQKEDLGGVRFVPLVGEAGWNLDEIQEEAVID
jgi:protein-L-isoaspartate(D-aspartate) O-methyltransferase